MTPGSVDTSSPTTLEPGRIAKTQQHCFFVLLGHTRDLQYRDVRVVIIMFNTYVYSLFLSLLLKQHNPYRNATTNWYTSPRLSCAYSLYDHLCYVFWYRPKCTPPHARRTTIVQRALKGLSRTLEKISKVRSIKDNTRVARWLISKKLSITHNGGYSSQTKIVRREETQATRRKSSRLVKFKSPEQSCQSKRYCTIMHH